MPQGVLSPDQYGSYVGRTDVGTLVWVVHMCISGLFCPRVLFLEGVCQFAPKICRLVSDVLSYVKTASFFDNPEAADDSNSTAVMATVQQQQWPTAVEANHGRQRQLTTTAAYTNNNSSR
jgi:hypothetical protein